MKTTKKNNNEEKISGTLTWFRRDHLTLVDDFGDLEGDLKFTLTS